MSGPHPASAGTWILSHMTRMTSTITTNSGMCVQYFTVRDNALKIITTVHTTYVMHLDMRISHNWLHGTSNYEYHTSSIKYHPTASLFDQKAQIVNNISRIFNFFANTRKPKNQALLKQRFIKTINTPLKVVQ